MLMRNRKVFMYVGLTLGGVISLWIALVPWFSGRLAQYWSDREHIARIEFYGQVVDAQGRPIRQAEVSVQVDGYNLFYLWGGGRGATTKLCLTTDAAGRFSVIGYFGDSLSIMSISSPGYEWVYETRPHDDYDMDSGFSYAPQGPSYVPDPKQPAIFPMAKAGEVLSVLPSRGGSQRGHDGRLTPNGSMTPKHPSVHSALPPAKN